MKNKILAAVFALITAWLPFAGMILYNSYFTAMDDAPRMVSSYNNVLRIQTGDGYAVGVCMATVLTMCITGFIASLFYNKK